jgi:O-antigen ligase
MLMALAVGLLAGMDPRLAVAATLGVAFVALVLADLTVGVCLFTFLAFLDLVPEVGGSVLSFIKAAGALLALSWLAAATSRPDFSREFPAAHPVAFFGLVAFVGWSGASVLWAESGAEAQTATMRFALSAILFLIVFGAVRRREHARWLVMAFVAGAFVSAAFGLVSSSGVNADAGGRLTGTIGDPNELAAILVAGLVLALALALTSPESPLLRLASMGVAGLCLLGILLSLSRGGLVALFAALLVGLVVAGRWRGMVGAAAVAIALSSFTYFAFYASPAATERITRTGGGTGREDIWTVGWRMVEANPVRGVGSGNFPVSSVHYLLEPGTILRDEFIVDTPKVAHNTYLGILAELGVVGLALFGLLVAFSLTSGLRAARAFERSGDREMELLARALVIALAGLLAACFFISEPFSKQLWLLLALGPALWALARRPPAEGPGPDARGRTGPAAATRRRAVALTPGRP